MQESENSAEIERARSQPAVSRLANGRAERFSIERLIRFLNELHRDVEIRVRARSPGGGRGTLRIR